MNTLKNPKKYTKLTCWMFVLALTFFFAGCGKNTTSASENDESVGAVDKKPLQVSLIANGPLTDWGFNQALDESLKDAGNMLGDAVEVKALGNIPENGDAERIMRRLISTGSNVIIAASFGYQDFTVKLAQEFPEVKFMQAWGFKPAENLGTFSSKMYQAWYVMGIVAGSMSESGKLGVVAAHPIPPMKWQINAYTLGAKSVNPDVVVSVTFINHWFDPGLAADASDALISQGCDVLTGVLDNSVAVAQTAEKRGIMLIGHNTDLSKFAPKAILVGTQWKWGKLYADEISKMISGEWKGTDGDANGGFKEGYVGITDFSARVPEDVKKRALDTIRQIEAGELVVYQGPIFDNEGNEAVKEGQALSHGEIMGMNWFVEGVK